MPRSSMQCRCAQSCAAQQAGGPAALRVRLRGATRTQLRAPARRRLTPRLCQNALCPALPAEPVGCRLAPMEGRLSGDATGDALRQCM